MAKTFKDSKEVKAARQYASKKPKMEPYSKTNRKKL